MATPSPTAVIALSPPTGEKRNHARSVMECGNLPFQARSVPRNPIERMPYCPDRETAALRHAAGVTSVAVTAEGIDLGIKGFIIILSKLSHIAQVFSTCAITKLDRAFRNRMVQVKNT